MQVIAWGGFAFASERALPAEVAVAMTYDKVSYAVLMATPADLEDFAFGFSLSESIIEDPSDIADLDVAVVPMGIECRITLTPARRDVLERRRRRLAGPMGCGLCGLDSLAEALRPLPKSTADVIISAEALLAAVQLLPASQPLNAQSRALHAAAFLAPDDGSMRVREDVGRHNALDKLIGAVWRAGGRGDQGIVLLTSRISIDLIQKAAVFGTCMMVGVSVPSATAVRGAEAAGITLVGVARTDGFEVFSHPRRIIMAYAPGRSSG